MRIKSIISITALILSLIGLSPTYAVTGLTDELPKELLEEAKSSYIFLLVAGFQSGVNSSGARYFTGFLGRSPKPPKILHFRWRKWLQTRQDGLFQQN